MNLLRKLLAYALASSIAAFAIDDFELPEFSENEQTDSVKFAPIESVTITEKTLGEDPTFPGESNLRDSVKLGDTSAPVESSPEKSVSITERDMPANLNRPVRVGIFLNESELYIKQNVTEFRITATDGKLKILSGKKTETVKTKTFRPQGKCTAVASEKKSLARSCFPGEITVTATKNKLTAINIVDVEEYLKGVIPYEIGKLDSSRFSALESQAIAARTYVYKHLGSRESMGFDVYADTKDQVYKGLSGASPLTDSAVSKTAGIVMTYSGEFIIAYYHSTCGGETETLATWGRPDLPYLQSQPDLRPDGTPWCSESKYSTWERRFNDKEIVALFKQNAKEAKAKISNFNEIQSISILDTLPSGRVLTLEIFTDKGMFQILGDKTRFLFKKNGTILPSSFFRIGHDGKEWIIQGKGFGHGVGMCQMGVRARAHAGEDFATILTHYYPGITLERLKK